MSLRAIQGGRVTEGDTGRDCHRWRYREGVSPRVIQGGRVTDGATGRACHRGRYREGVSLTAIQGGRVTDGNQGGHVTEGDIGRVITVRVCHRGHTCTQSQTHSHAPLLADGQFVSIEFEYLASYSLLHSSNIVLSILIIVNITT